MFNIDRDELIQVVEYGYVSAFILFMFYSIAHSFYKILKENKKNED